MQMPNSTDCSGDPQQIVSVQIDNDDLRKAVCSLNLRHRKIIQYSMSIGQKQFKTNTHSFSKCFRTITFTYYW